MKDQSHSINKDVVVRSYEQYYSVILNYISYRISHKYEAEDLTQDVFVRLLDYKPMLCEQTVKFFLFTIARNIVTDYIRRYYKKQEVASYLYDSITMINNETEEHIVVKDILLLERNYLKTFPEQRRFVYSLNRFENETTQRIAQRMELSPRTVENHLLLARKSMRAYLKQCI